MVDVHFTFTARISLTSENPWLLEKKAREQAEQEERNKGPPTLVLQPYIVAKQTAHRNGQPIPTYEEFKALQDDLSSNAAGSKAGKHEDDRDKFNMDALSSSLGAIHYNDW
ncbi:hypothetical protein LTR09_000812 [Extremus antarcticus]|uniref:Uncharacterized protein n=1 Tax=Extremus antarcticus TaxID=702011 RepID=A0AAJ0GKG5_9PEZI|nr:hypothetical protein LTR09_000812 [Extremus antarcticus]